ncbi:MAG: HNH endonuclease [Dehalococcoidia bacterium]
MHCQICGDTRNLDQHHIQPKGMGGSGDPAIEAAENKITLCRICHRNIHEGGWLLQRSEDELRVVDLRTGELIMRRLYDRSFDASAFLHQLTRAESSLEQLVKDVPFLTDDQLVEAFASAHSLGKRAWVIQAAILYEAQERSVYGDHSLEAIARRFDISIRQAQKYALVWKLYFGDGVNVDAILLNEPSWYVVAASESSDPEFWLGHAQDRKAQDSRYSIAEFREDICLGREAIEAGVETPVPPCPWQTTYCEKVLELITSVPRCRDCSVGQRLLGIAKQEQLTASNPIP